MNAYTNFFIFSCVLECIQGHKIVDEHTFLRNIYVKFQAEMLVRKFLAELLYSDCTHCCDNSCLLI